MTARDSLSVCDKLLVAAFRCEQAGQRRLSAEDLVVSAWKNFPATFGLSGHTDQTGKPVYPDSNRVFAEIMGSKPIRKRGLLEKVGTKMYQLTETGRDRARQLDGALQDQGAEGGGQSKIRLGRQMVEELKRLLDSRAVRKVDNEQGDTLTFHDACVFWGITPHSAAIDLTGKHANLERAIVAAREAIAGGASRFEHGGGAISKGTLDLLERTHRELMEKFEAELAAIRKRTDQRRR